MDKDFLLSLKNGDTYAFEQFLSMYEKQVFNYCLRVLKNKDLAIDITQDTFIKVFSNRKNINPEKNIKTWLFTIATNAMYDFFRSKKRHKEVSIEDINESESENLNLDESSYKKNILVSDIDRGLDQINVEYKKALILFYQQGFDYKEIADILSLPINTVKTHISRGKAELKTKLSSYSD